MNELILFAVISSLIITCIHILFWDGMAFGLLRSVFDSFIPYFWQKPLYSCIICMASIWGTTIYFVAINFGYSLGNDWLFIPYIFVVCGINTLISGVIYLASEKHSLNLSQEQMMNEIAELKEENMHLKQFNHERDISR